MSGESLFRIAIAILLGLFVTIRIYFHRIASQVADVREFESRTNLGVRVAAAVLFFGAIVAYLIYPQWLAWGALAFPDWLRWLGASIAFSGIVFLLWVHKELGKNFRGTLHLRKDHEFITRGPYRRIRHPMYTSFYIVVFGLGLLTANWILGGGMIAGLTGVMLSRVRHEEAVLAGHFGDAYRSYKARTGLFWPRFRA